eukprot:scaffold58078_cov65-Phaeocystis_antarctica.AAC.4
MVCWRCRQWWAQACHLGSGGAQRRVPTAPLPRAPPVAHHSPHFARDSWHDTHWGPYSAACARRSPPLSRHSCRKKERPPASCPNMGTRYESCNSSSTTVHGLMKARLTL